MTRLPRSIRWRIQLWHGVLLLLVLGGFGATAYRLQRDTELRHLDAELGVRVAALHASLDRGRRGGDRPPPPPHKMGEPRDERLGRPPEGGGRGRPPRPGSFVLPEDLESLFDAAGDPPFYFHAWTRDGSVFGAAVHAPRDLPQPARGSAPNGTRTRGQVREVWSFTPPGECLLAGVSTMSLEARLARFAGWLIACGLAVLALGLAGGAWLAARAIAPIGQISATAARIADGHLSERINTAEQESELGQLAATLNDTFARLETTFVEQARFISDAAHELCTPTSIILAQTQLALHRPRSAEELQETITTVRRAAQRMQSLIDSLLTLARLDAHSEPLQQVRCDLAALVQETMELLRPLADERGIILASELAPAAALGDPEHLVQIFTNLLSNALKYCRPGDRVRLSTSQENDRAIFRIADTGPGIAPEHLPHLFERFYRADASRNRATGGAGLGLAICKTLAEAQQGDLTVESTLAQGSTFTLTLPQAPAHS